MTAIAWWLADRVSIVICEDLESRTAAEKGFANVVQECLVPADELSDTISNFVRTLEKTTPFRMATLKHSIVTPWSAILLASLGEKVHLINLRDNDDRLTEIDETLLQQLLLDGGHEPESDSLLFRNHAQLRKQTLDTWSRDFPEGIKSLLTSRHELIAALRSNEHLAKLLTDLPAMNREARIVPLNSMLVAARTGQLPAEPLFQFFNNVDTARSVLSDFDVDELNFLLEVLLILQRTTAATARHDVPHLLAWLVEQCPPANAGNRDALIMAVACAAARTSAYSAVRRLREAHRNDDVATVLGALFSYLQDQRNRLPSWAWSKLRPLVANLR